MVGYRNIWRNIFRILRIEVVKLIVDVGMFNFLVKSIGMLCFDIVLVFDVLLVYCGVDRNRDQMFVNVLS